MIPKEMDWNAIAEQNAGSAAISGELGGLTIDLGLNEESNKNMPPKVYYNSQTGYSRSEGTLQDHLNQP